MDRITDCPDMTIAVDRERKTGVLGSDVATRFTGT